MEFFSGTVQHAMDDKNRIRIPAKFRGKLGKEFYFMAHSNGCIGVYSQEALDALMLKLDSVTSGDKEKVMAKRKLFGSIEQAVEDGQGRTTLSKFYRDHMGAVKNIVSVGMGTYFEIWSEEKFREYNESMTFDDAFSILDF